MEHLEPPRTLDVSRETLNRLKSYEKLLLKWQPSINLVGVGTIAHFWTRHVADSLRLLSIAADMNIWIDIGSGGGFPGMPLAIVLAERSGAVVHLVERDARKCAFLREVARETGASAVIHHGHASRVLCEIQTADVVTSRAVTSLTKLVAWSKPLLLRGAIGLFLKGQDVELELTNDPIFSNVTLEFVCADRLARGFIVRVCAA